MRRIFIDLGSYDGDTIEQFFNWGKLIGDPYDFYIFGFEPNLKFREQHKSLQKNKRNVKIENKAAWTYDGTLAFWVDLANEPVGSTAMKSKAEKLESVEELVQCFDFSMWLKQFKDDYVIVKMDIEGAEFPVLEKMLSDGTAEIPDKLFVEFHPNKVIEYTTTDKNDLIKRFKKFVDIEEWH